MEGLVAVLLGAGAAHIQSAEMLLQPQITEAKD
jgi:hypothetical protein